MNAPNLKLAVYLDVSELVATLGLFGSSSNHAGALSPLAVTPRAELPDRELLRWRQDVVEAWLANPPL